MNIMMTDSFDVGMKSLRSLPSNELPLVFSNSSVSGKPVTIVSIFSSKKTEKSLAIAGDLCGSEIVSFYLS